jgi:hypothetical protein
MVTQREARPAGVTALVAGIIAELPKTRVSVPSGSWHWAFLQLRDRHRSDVPELNELEFDVRPGVSPVSERLEHILQVIDMGGAGSTLNPALLVRQFDTDQQRRLRDQFSRRLRGRRKTLQMLAKELQELLEHAPSRSTAS